MTGFGRFLTPPCAGNGVTMNILRPGLIAAALLFLFLSGCNPYPVKKDNLLAKGGIVLEYEFRNSYPNTVMLDRTKKDFERDVRRLIAGRLNGPEDESYFNKRMEIAPFNYAHNIVYPIYAQEAVALLGETLASALKDDIRAVIFSDASGRSGAYLLDPPVARVVNSRFSNFTQGDATIEITIHSRITGNNPAETWDSTARILVDHAVSIDYAKLRASINSVKYEIDSNSTGKAMLINDAGLLKSIGSARLSVDEGVASIRKDLLGRYDRDLLTTAEEIVKGLGERGRGAEKRQ